MDIDTGDLADTPDELTPLPDLKKQSHLTFCELILEGSSQKDAYLAAFPAASAKNASGLSSRLMTKPEIKAYLAARRDRMRVAMSARTVLTRQRKREILSEIAEGDNQNKDKLAAISIDNRMEGHEKPVERDTTVTIHHILSRVIEGGSSGFVDDTSYINTSSEPLSLEVVDESIGVDDEPLES